MVYDLVNYKNFIPLHLQWNWQKNYSFAKKT